MSTQVQLRGGSAADHQNFTGATREVTVDTTNKTLVVHDGSTAGGTKLAKESQLPTNVSDLTNDTGFITAEDLPQIPATIDDLSDVDTATTAPTDGQALIYDEANSQWIPGDVASGGGGGYALSSVADAISANKLSAEKTEIPYLYTVTNTSATTVPSPIVDYGYNNRAWFTYLGDGSPWIEFEGQFYAGFTDNESAYFAYPKHPMLKQWEPGTQVVVQNNNLGGNWEFTVESISYNANTFEWSLAVTQTNGPSLLGWEWSWGNNFSWQPPDREASIVTVNRELPVNIEDYARFVPGDTNYKVLAKFELDSYIFNYSAVLGFSWSVPDAHAVSWGLARGTSQNGTSTGIGSSTPFTLEVIIQLPKATDRIAGTQPLVVFADKNNKLLTQTFGYYTENGSFYNGYLERNYNFLSYPESFNDVDGSLHHLVLMRDPLKDPSNPDRLYYLTDGELRNINDLDGVDLLFETGDINDGFVTWSPLKFANCTILGVRATLGSGAPYQGQLTGTGITSYVKPTSFDNNHSAVVADGRYMAALYDGRSELPAQSAIVPNTKSWVLDKGFFFGSTQYNYGDFYDLTQAYRNFYPGDSITGNENKQIVTLESYSVGDDFSLISTVAKLKVANGFTVDYDYQTNETVITGLPEQVLKKTANTFYTQDPAPTASNSVAIGNNTVVVGYSVAIGSGALATGGDQAMVALGAQSHCSASNTIAIGYGAQAFNTENIAIGYGIRAYGKTETAIGAHGNCERRFRYFDNMRSGFERTGNIYLRNETDYATTSLLNSPHSNPYNTQKITFALHQPYSSLVTELEATFALQASNGVCKIVKKTGFIYRGAGGVPVYVETSSSTPVSNLITTAIDFTPAVEVYNSSNDYYLQAKFAFGSNVLNYANVQTAGNNVAPTWVHLFANYRTRTMTQS